MARLRLLVLLVLAGLLASLIAGCGGSVLAQTTSTTKVYTKVDGYVALVPSVLRAGETASFSFTLTNGTKPARSQVTVAVLDKSKTKTIASGTGDITGTGTVAFKLPTVTPGDYQVKVQGSGFSKVTPVKIEAGTLLFLETDKPIYKPGQTIQIRLVALDSELKPVQTQATVEVQDAKGVKISKQVLTTDQYGTVTAQLDATTRFADAKPHELEGEEAN